MEKLNRAQKCSILGLQNLGSGGARAPGPPPDPRLLALISFVVHEYPRLCKDKVDNNT